ncbi:MAG: efflux RND transporter periplasmic adaptor subunit [Bacteroidales bacterium]
MKIIKQYKAILLAAVALISFSALTLHCTTKHDHSEEKESHEDHPGEIVFSKEQAALVGLQTTVVKPHTFCEVIKTSGQIQASQGDEITVVATTNGVVSFANTSVSEGTPINHGETIVTISSKNMSDGDPALKTKIQYETALKEFKRSEDLVKDKIISEREYEQARLNYETARVGYEAIRKNQSSGGLRLTAPMSGFIKSRLVNEGEYVSVGQPVAIISQNKQLQLRAEVSDKYYSHLNTISGANFKMPYSDKIYKLSEMNGKLLSFGKSTRETSFYLPVTFEFNNVGNVVAGSFVEVYLLATPKERVLTVPASALIEEQGVYSVFIRLDEEGYRKQEVELGISNGDEFEVRKGLKAGDEIVTAGAIQVKLAASSSAIPEGHSH